MTMSLHEAIIELLFIILPAIVMSWLHKAPTRNGEQ